jgi:hypothetical protein
MLWTWNEQIGRESVYQFNIFQTTQRCLVIINGHKDTCNMFSFPFEIQTSWLFGHKLKKTVFSGHFYEMYKCQMSVDIWHTDTPKLKSVVCDIDIGQ